MATFEPAPKALHAQVTRVLKECYTELYELSREKVCPFTFDLLIVRADRDANGEPVGHPLKCQGRTAAAVIKVVPKADRALGMADVQIRFDGDYWDKLEEPQQDALIDHELYHLVLVREDGLPKRDDLSRLRFKMREHDYDFGWFVEVAQRRGIHAPEVQQANRMMAAHGQILFAFAELPAPTLPGMAGAGMAPHVGTPPSPGPLFRVVEGEAAGDGEAPEAEETAEGGTWLLWEQLTTEQREVAEAQWEGAVDRSGQFRINEAGDPTHMRPLEGEQEPETPASETPAEPATDGKKPKGRRQQAKSSTRKAASKR